ncbi:MAG TPA: hypothetical protein VG267_18325 [Terracidiphilus sp.]|jgi:hypothetical protein|nr:hypothetical protein [Terracidiphilus sp.]
MNKRPIAVTVVAILLVLGSAAGLAGDFMNSHSLSADHFESVWVGAVNVLGIVAAVFLFRGSNWARWLAIAWIAFHVAVSFWNPWQQLAMHGLIFALFAWILFRRDARAFFHPPQASA